MNGSNQKVTIVTVTYNAQEYLEQTIKSVIGQDYQNIEYIIIDGGSTDGTVKIIKKYEKYLSYWISEPDKGIYDAMNKAIDRATGEWINFMNAGDKFSHNTSINKFIENVKEGIDLYCGGINFIDLISGQSSYRPPHTLEKIWENVPCWHQGMFISTKLMKEYKYSLKYKIAGDHEFFLRCYSDNKKFQFIDTPIADMLAGGMHQKEAITARVESMKIIADYAIDTNVIYESAFFKALYADAPSFDNIKFYSQFNLFFKEIDSIGLKYNKIALYGYGAIAKTVISLLNDKVSVVIDQNRYLHDNKNYPNVSSLENLKGYDFDAILITVIGREKEIIKSLIENYKIDISKIITIEV
jgi:glycosyltransferase involved in cell wall biosynthesis